MFNLNTNEHVLNFGLDFYFVIKFRIEKNRKLFYNKHFN